MESLAGATPFWQNKPPKDLPDEIFHCIVTQYEPWYPYFYEYVLCAAGESVGPRSMGGGSIVSIVHDPPLMKTRTSFLEGGWWQVIEDIESPKVTFGKPVRQLLWVTSEPTMSDADFLNNHRALEDFTVHTTVYNPDSDNWKEVTVFRLACIAYGRYMQLTGNLRLFIDNHDGTRGGPIDMLRLPRFKTLSKGPEYGSFLAPSFQLPPSRAPILLRRRFHLQDIADKVALSMSEL